MSSKASIQDLIAKIRNMPSDVVDPKLESYALQLSAEVITLGAECVRAEHKYKKELARCREKRKTKADAEILAETSNAYCEWRKLKYLREDAKEVIRTANNILRSWAEERYIQH